MDCTLYGTIFTEGEHLVLQLFLLQTEFTLNIINLVVKSKTFKYIPKTILNEIN